MSNGTLVWDVQFDAPEVLYYQCTSHDNMGGRIYTRIDSVDSITFNNIIVGGATTITGSGINAATGIITASSFVGDLTGTASAVSGLSTTISINTSGIITATSFVGNLTGTASAVSGLSTTISINTSGIITASSLDAAISNGYWVPMEQDTIHLLGPDLLVPKMILQFIL